MVNIISLYKRKNSTTYKLTRFDIMKKNSIFILIFFEMSKKYDIYNFV